MYITLGNFKALNHVFKYPDLGITEPNLLHRLGHTHNHQVRKLTYSKGLIVSTPVKNFLQFIEKQRMVKPILLNNILDTSPRVTMYQY